MYIYMHMYMYELMKHAKIVITLEDYNHRRDCNHRRDYKYTDMRSLRQIFYRAVFISCYKGRLGCCIGLE